MTLENIELEANTKTKIKIISAEKDIPMKKLITKEAKNIIDEKKDIPLTERETNRSHLIIDINPTLKKKIKTYCEDKEVRIRDFWVECANQIINKE